MSSRVFLLLEIIWLKASIEEPIFMFRDVFERLQYTETTETETVNTFRVRYAKNQGLSLARSIDSLNTRPALTLIEL